MFLHVDLMFKSMILSIYLALYLGVAALFACQMGEVSHMGLRSWGRWKMFQLSSRLTVGRLHGPPLSLGWGPWNKFFQHVHLHHWLCEAICGVQDMAFGCMFASYMLSMYNGITINRTLLKLCLSQLPVVLEHFTWCRLISSCMKHHITVM